MSNASRSGRPVSTELESCVLAIVGRLGPCTPYVVRRYLAESESSYWSASAGAIYPLLKRMKRSGWVSFEEQPFGSRKRRTYNLTRRGRQVLHDWLAAPLPDSAAAYTHDPIRTRIFFLDMISPAARQGALDDAIAKTIAVLERHRADRDARPDLSPWELAGREGAIRELEARLQWLREVRASIDA